jgi:hypothetical protein
MREQGKEGKEKDPQHPKSKAFSGLIMAPMQMMIALNTNGKSSQRINVALLYVYTQSFSNS